RTISMGCTSEVNVARTWNLSPELRQANHPSGSKMSGKKGCKSLHTSLNF
ncbi:Hypothetical protein FKW44_015061, partial [Caligus rogercresseyi]